MTRTLALGRILTKQPFFCSYIIRQRLGTAMIWVLEFHPIVVTLCARVGSSRTTVRARVLLVSQVSDASGTREKQLQSSRKKVCGDSVESSILVDGAETRPLFVETNLDLLLQLGRGQCSAMSRTLRAVLSKRFLHTGASGVASCTGRAASLVATCRMTQCVTHSV